MTIDTDITHRVYLWPLVHGSLARAGKVKSQTPKVEKQEKKKSPKGRAKKRMLYNRRFVVLFQRCLAILTILLRFVNVTTLPGGKRRMCVFLPYSFATSIPLFLRATIPPVI